MTLLLTVHNTFMHSRCVYKLVYELVSAQAHITVIAPIWDPFDMTRQHYSLTVQ